MAVPSLLYRKIIYCSSDSLDPEGVLNTTRLCVRRDMVSVSGSGGGYKGGGEVGGGVRARYVFEEACVGDGVSRREQMERYIKGCWGGMCSGRGAEGVERANKGGV